jgi:hypothetical protein
MIDFLGRRRASEIILLMLAALLLGASVTEGLIIPAVESLIHVR